VNDWIQTSPACFSLEIIMMSDQRRRGERKRGGNRVKKKGKAFWQHLDTRTFTPKERNKKRAKFKK
jgi:hypothetical protein